MRQTLRLFASVKPARYLEAGRPTGLTGVYTHPSPRGALLFLYHSTLDKLKVVPEHSLYRQSVEALTKHRLAIVENTVPQGFEEWSATTRKRIAEQVEESKRLQSQVTAAATSATETTTADKWDARVREIRAQLAHLDEESPEDAQILLNNSGRGKVSLRAERGSETFIVNRYAHEVDEREPGPGPAETAAFDALQIARERKAMRLMYQRMLEAALNKREATPEELRRGLEAEEVDSAPQWTADQVSEVENKIGAGLIEEVINVAEAELKLVDTMVQAKVWEPLEEQPAPGQWEYFERKSA